MLSTAALTQSQEDRNRTVVSRGPSTGQCSSGMDPMATTMEGGELTAAISGEFDMAATFTVEPALERALEEPELRGLTLDLSNVTFIDSTGIGVVLWLAGELDARELAMRIVPGPPEVQRVFESVGIAEVLPFQTA